MNIGSTRVVIDATSYLLFEATGDSEADTVPEMEYSGEDDDDDAHSCSYFRLPLDTSKAREIRSVLDVNDHGNDDNNIHVNGTVNEENIYDEEEDDDLEEGVVDQRCGGGIGDEAAPPPEINAAVEEEYYYMNDEKERDRLFWESCFLS